MKKETPNGPSYTIIPNKALDALVEKGASVSDIVVYQVLCRHHNPDNNKVWPSLNTIAKLSGCSQRNVQRSISFLCSSGMILKAKVRHHEGDYDSNVYYLPHCISFQIESILLDKKNLRKNRKALLELQQLESTILRSINEQIGRDNMSLGRDKKSLGKDKKAEGRDKSSDGVETGSPINNTTINTTINITKNVKNVNSEDPEEDLTSGLTQLKRYEKELRGGTEKIGDLDILKNLNREHIVKELMSELNDIHSEQWFRKIANKVSFCNPQMFESYKRNL